MSLSAEEIIALINAQVDPLNELVRTSILPKLNTLEEQISRLTEKQSVTMTDTGGRKKSRKHKKRKSKKSRKHRRKTKSHYRR